MLSYAGINLPDQTGPVLERLNLLDPADLLDFTRVTYPGPALAALGWPSQPRDRTPRVGSLWWPNGASRFALGMFLVTNNELTAIRQQVYQAPGVSRAQPFVINDGKRSLTTSLWMLPPRPLTQITGNNDAWLLPLVDERYHWWEKAGNITVTPGITAWTDLYSSIATALGITLTVDAIPAAYLKPTADFGVGYDSLPLLLDAVASSIGQCIVRDFAGGVRAWSVTNSQTQAAANLSLNPPLAGGEMSLVAGNNIDQPALVPQSVTVTYPRQDSGTPTPTNPTAYTVTLASLALPEFAGTTGAPYTKLIRSSCVAYWTGGAAPANNAELQALANQYATDFYRYTTSPMDAAYSGVINWTPEGLTDGLEFFHRGEQIYTRVQRQPWEEWTGPQNALGTYAPQPATPFVALTSATSQVINLLYGGTLTVYPATQYALVAGVWTAGSSCWFFGANGEVPPLELRLLCRHFGDDTSGVPVYCKDEPTAMVEVTSLSTSNITLADGGTLTVYPAKSRQLVSGSLNTGVPAWYWPPNGETPGLNSNYPSIAVSVDNSGVVVWSSVVPSAFVLGNETIPSDITWTLENGADWTINLGSGGGEVIFDAPVKLCGYLFECCTTWALSASTYDNLALPAVGSPDRGAIVYDVSTSNSGGTTISGLVPVASGPAINTGDITAATNASPIVLTVPGWTTTPTVGQVVVVAGVNGNTAANGTWTIQAVTATTLTLASTTGNGAFTASAGSTVRLVGPQKIRLVNVGANPITLDDQGLGSLDHNRIFMPPTYSAGGKVTLEQDDTITLWWDYCTDHVWKVIACTVDIDSGGTTIQWVKITSATSSVITIGTGTVVAFPAVLTSFSTATGSWVDTATAVWYYPASGRVPILNNRYECVSFGTATDLKAVWGRNTESFSGASYINFNTTSVPNNALTTLLRTGATAAYDTDSYTANFTLPRTGYYKGYFQVAFSGTGTYVANVRVSDSGLAVISQVQVPVNGSSTTLQVFFDVPPSSPGTLVVQAFQNSGLAMNVSIAKAVIWMVSPN